MHPRPSPIAASLYTLRDLNADVIVMHGPHGCCFRTGRLLESDGVRVVTTAMAENDFILGASQKLEENNYYISYIAKKNDLAIRIQLETNNLDYDENALYLFSNSFFIYPNLALSSNCFSSSCINSKFSIQVLILLMQIVLICSIVIMFSV